MLPMKLLVNENIDTLQWGGLWAVLVLATIYARPLIPIDETRYLSVAWEMWHTKAFLVPHINGEIYTQKPPLLFWLIQVMWQIFGVSEWAGRLVSPLFGLFSIMATTRLARKLWPGEEKISRAVPFILLGSAIWMFYGSLTMFDTLLTFFVLIGLHALVDASKQPGFRPWLGFSIAVGFGFLAKGPVVLVFLLPAAWLAPLWLAAPPLRWKSWYAMSWLALLLGVVIALLWVVPATLSVGIDRANQILLHQTVGRMVESFAHKRPFYWYLLLSPLLFLPWSVWPPAWKGVKRITGDRSLCFCQVVFIASFASFSMMSGKQIHYLMPVYPVFALVIARIGLELSWNGLRERLPVGIVFILIAIVLAVVPWLHLHGDAGLLEETPFWLALFPLSIAAMLLFHVRSALASVKLITASLAFLVVSILLATGHQLHKVYEPQNIADLVRQYQGEKHQVAVFPGQLSDQLQFTGRLTDPLIPASSAAELVSWAQLHPEQYCLVFLKDRRQGDFQQKVGEEKYKNGWLLLMPATSFAPFNGAQRVPSHSS